MVQRSHGVQRLRRNQFGHAENKQSGQIDKLFLDSVTSESPLNVTDIAVKVGCSVGRVKAKLKHLHTHHNVDVSSVINVTKTKRAIKVSDDTPITLTTIFSTFKKYIEPNCRMLGESINDYVKIFFDGNPTFANFRYQSEKKEVAKMVVKVMKPEFKKLTNVKLRALVEDADRVRYERSRDRAERYTREVPHCRPSSTYDAFGGNGRLYLLTHEKYQEILKVMLKNKAEKETFFGKSVTVKNFDYGTYLAVGQSEIRISVKIHEGKLTIA